MGSGSGGGACLLFSLLLILLSSSIDYSLNLNANDAEMLDALPLLSFFATANICPPNFPIFFLNQPTGHRRNAIFIGNKLTIPELSDLNNWFFIDLRFNETTRNFEIAFEDPKKTSGELASFSISLYTIYTSNFFYPRDRDEAQGRGLEISFRPMFDDRGDRLPQWSTNVVSNTWFPGPDFFFDKA